jgi:hypothetical protein
MQLEDVLKEELNKIALDEAIPRIAALLKEHGGQTPY